jgi:Family of unknown function (DUF6011)
MNCIVCNKPLIDPESIVRCIGPDCWERLQADVGKNLTNFKDRYCGTLTDNVILMRGNDKAALTNVTHKIFMHSPQGYEWGNMGKGAADLALNILFHFGTPEIAIRWHQNFKHDFLATMPYEGGIIEGKNIKKWIAAKTKTLF